MSVKATGTNEEEVREIIVHVPMNILYIKPKKKRKSVCVCERERKKRVGFCPLSI